MEVYNFKYYTKSNLRNILVKRHWFFSLLSLLCLIFLLTLTFYLYYVGKSTKMYIIPDIVLFVLQFFLFPLHDSTHLDCFITLEKDSFKIVYNGRDFFENHLKELNIEYDIPYSTVHVLKYCESNFTLLINSIPTLTVTNLKNGKILSYNQFTISAATEHYIDFEKNYEVLELISKRCPVGYQIYK